MKPDVNTLSKMLLQLTSQEITYSFHKSENTKKCFKVVDAGVGMLHSFVTTSYLWLAIPAVLSSAASPQGTQLDAFSLGNGCYCYFSLFFVERHTDSLRRPYSLINSLLHPQITVDYTTNLDKVCVNVSVTCAQANVMLFSYD